MDKNSRVLTEIRGFVFAASVKGKSDRELFQELLEKITGAKKRRANAIGVSDFTKGKVFARNWQVMLSWDIINFLVEWVEEINLTKKAQRIVISIIIGSEVMDEEDLEELAEVLDKKDLNKVIKKWIELQLIQAK